MKYCVRCFILSVFATMSFMSYGADRNQTYFDDQVYWRPQFVHIDYQYDGDKPKSAVIEFSFDDNLQLFEAWTVDYSGESYCGTIVYPFVLEVALIINDTNAGAITVGNKQNQDWSFLSSTGPVPYTYKDTEMFDSVTGDSKIIGIGIVRPSLLESHVNYQIQFIFDSIDPKINWSLKQAQVRFRLNVDVASAVHIDFDPGTHFDEIGGGWSTTYGLARAGSYPPSEDSAPYTAESDVVNTAFAIEDASALYIPITAPFWGSHSN